MLIRPNYGEYPPRHLGIGIALGLAVSLLLGLLIGVVR
jgi:hypothetical protein